MSFAKISDIAAQYQKNTTAPLGFVFRDLKTGETVSYHGDRVFPTASSYKIFILAELFRKVAAGECSLSDRIVLNEEDKSIGSGLLAQFGGGLNPTLKDYATLMMIISDNTATDILFRFLGRDNIKKNVLEPLGLVHTKCDFDCRTLIENYFELGEKTIMQMLEENGGAYPSFHNSKWYRCETEENDETTPLEAAKMLELLYRGEWVSPETSTAMLNIMKACQTNTRIPKYLPLTTPVAHKTGTLDKLNADIGIVYTPKGDYILCLFYNGNLASLEEYERNEQSRFSENYLAELSRDIYRAYLED